MIFLLLYIGQLPTVPVDLIEINNHYSRDGYEWRQIILWEYEPDYCRFDVIAWEMKESARPRHRGRWVLIEVEGVLYKTRVFVVSHTYIDPEVKNRYMRNPKHRNCYDPRKVEK